MHIIPESSFSFLGWTYEDKEHACSVSTVYPVLSTEPGT